MNPGEASIQQARMQVDEASYYAEGQRCRFTIRSGDRVAVLSLHRERAEFWALLQTLGASTLRPTWGSELVCAQGPPEHGDPVAYDGELLYLTRGPFGWLEDLLERTSGRGFSHHGVRICAALG